MTHQHPLARAAALTALLLTMPCLAAPAAKDPHTHTPMIQPGAEYGEKLKASPMGVGPSMDVAVAEGHLFAIGKGELRVLTNREGEKPVLVGKLTGLGNTRQIAITGGHAYITAREEGLFIVDIREPSKPTLVYHYDTAELATAIAVSGNVAAIGNRFAGIELIDISTPSAPRYLSCVRAGEVQSVAFHGTCLYAGAWSEQEVAVIDASDPTKPVLVNHVPLDGFGDGLDVQDTLLAAATGHHARGNGRSLPGDGRFGAGHGVEFFDISQPAEPRRLSCLKFPPFYRRGMDMWGVVLSGGYAFVNDTHNGYFLIDVRDPSKPRHLGWQRLSEVKGEFSPAAGLAVSKGRAFIAGAFDDLHLLETDLAQDPPAPTAPGPKVPASGRPAAAHGLPAYQVEGSIRAVVPWKEDLHLVAAGSAGWHIVRQTESGFEPVAVHSTKGFARDVAFHGDRIFVAEALAGLTIWDPQPDGGFKRIPAFQVADKSIHQVVVADDGRIAFLAVGGSSLYAVEIGVGGKAKPVLGPMSFPGLFYRDPFSPLAKDGRTFLAQWHATGLYEFVVENGKPRRGEWTFPQVMGTGAGATPWRDGWLATSMGGYILLKHGEVRTPMDIGAMKVEGVRVVGKPSVAGNSLFVSDPFLGDVTALDISDEKRPRLLGQIRVSGHPGRVKVHNQKALIPAARDGLLLWTPK